MAAFLKLLIAMLANNQNNQSRFFHNEGPATVAALLMRTPPTLLTVNSFERVQELVELLNREEETRSDIYKHLIFDFRVWARPAYSVRIGECLRQPLLARSHISLQVISSTSPIS